MSEWEFDDPNMPEEIAERLPPEKKALRDALRHETVAEAEEASVPSMPGKEPLGTGGGGTIVNG